MKKTWSHMKDQALSQRGTRVLMLAATSVIIIWGINQAQSVVVLFLVSAFLAIIGSVPVQWLERKGVPSVVAVSIVVAAMIAALLGTGVVVGASLNEFSRSLPSYQHRTQEMLLRLKAVVAKRGIAISDEAVLAYVNPGALMSGPGPCSQR